MNKIKYLIIIFLFMQNLIISAAGLEECSIPKLADFEVTKDNFHALDSCLKGICFALAQKKGASPLEDRWKIAILEYYNIIRNYSNLVPASQFDNIDIQFLHKLICKMNLFKLKNGRAGVLAICELVKFGVHSRDLKKMTKHLIGFFALVFF